MILIEVLQNKSKWMLMTVYGPNSSQRRMELWNELDMVRRRWIGAWCIGGDWNAIRYPSEKLGGSKTTRDETFLGLDKPPLFGRPAAKWSILYLVKSPEEPNYVQIGQISSLYRLVGDISRGLTAGPTKAWLKPLPYFG